jgi:potassium/hydrogen antiporter
MFAVDTLMFAAGVLFLLGIASSKFSARLGMPVLVLFLGLGMLAGSEGLGGIAFEDYALANALASIALALILFDGGLRTPMRSVWSAWRPALALSTLGVLLTAVLTGVAAAWVFGVPLLHGVLLGSIVGSTDAAAVFSVLRTSRIKLPDRLAATLEMESGSNDPMAIFLTIGLIAFITGQAESATAIALLFVLQFGVGALVGLAVGRGAAWAVNRVNLDAAGLYPILAASCGILAFGLAAVLDGSGFLAVYVAGIVIGNSDIVFKRGILLFHDAAAWLGQILLFIMLGLLSFPSRLLAVVGEGLLIALVLVLVARPIAVVISSLPFRFRPAELVFLSWVGLKGAVPITLATFPLMAGVEGSEVLFDVVFFVVLVSAVTQGWSLPAVARRLGLVEPSDPDPPLSIEITALRHVGAEIVEYTVAPSARVAGQALRNLALPDGVVVTLVVRDDEVIMPRGATLLRPGDHVFIAARTSLIPLVDRLFDPYAETPPLELGLTLSFRDDTTLGQLHRFFGLPGPTWSEQPLADLMEAAENGTPARLGPFLLSLADEPGYVTLTVAPEPTSPPEESVPARDRMTAGGVSSTDDHSLDVNELYGMTVRPLQDFGESPRFGDVATHPNLLWSAMTQHKLRSILATSDLTDSSSAGLVTAAALAAATGAELHAVHCVPKPVFPYWEGVVDESTKERWIDNARLDLEWQLRRVLGDETSVASIDVGIGEPVRIINDRATETSADLIVLGPHRPRGPFDDLVGTTADRVIRTSTVPCLIANRAVVHGLRRVLVPIDFSEPSLHALHQGVNWLLNLEGPSPERPLIVEILYISAFASPAARPMAVEPRLSQQVEAARERLSARKHIQVVPRILSAPMPVDGILRAAEESETSLIILGTHGFGTIMRALLGSVASAVVRTVPFPILLVPPPSRATGASE